MISATDPVSTLAVFQTKCVDPQLFYLVFGESVLNDAVGLVLFNAFSKFVTDSNANTGEVVIDMGEFVFSFILDSIGSPILGLLCGCCTALLFKYTNMKEHKLLELCVYVLIMYVPFLLAQVMGLSGIVTILFTGMTAKAYVVPNLSIETERTAEMLFRLFAHIAETSIFLELGLSVSGLASQSFHGMFIFWTLIACIIGRICNVYPITVIYNWRLRYLPTNPDEIKQHRIHDKNDNQMNEMSEISNDSGDGYNDHFGDDDDNVQSIPHVRRSKDNKQVTKNDSRHGKVCLTNLPSELDGIMKNQPQHKKKSNIPSSDVSSYETTTPAVRRDLIIRPKTAHMLCFSGLRGAVAYACARSFPNTYGNRTEFIFLTMAIVLITVFAFGSTTEPMLNMLKIDMNVDENKYMDDWNKKRQQASCILRWEEFIQRHVTREETCNEQYTHSKVSTNDQDETSCRHIASSDDDDNKNKTDVRNDEKMQHQIVGDDVVDEEKLGIMHEGIRQGYTSPSNHGSKRQLHSRRVETSLFDFGGL